ncbi:hypothetical protein HMPREF1613_01785 [Escherichia coli 908616]|nr:hypothetical protein HMPREF1613_01785 [Escherichia coli 908616]
MATIPVISPLPVISPVFTERYIRNLNELLPVLKRRWDVTPAIICAVEYLSWVTVSH